MPSQPSRRSLRQKEEKWGEGPARPSAAARAQPRPRSSSCLSYIFYFVVLHILCNPRRVDGCRPRGGESPMSALEPQAAVAAASDIVQLWDEGPLARFADLERRY